MVLLVRVGRVIGMRKTDAREARTGERVCILVVFPLSLFLFSVSGGSVLS